jgi:hypothetical protein
MKHHHNHLFCNNLNSFATSPSFLFSKLFYTTSLDSSPFSEYLCVPNLWKTTEEVQRLPYALCRLFPVELENELVGKRVWTDSAENGERGREAMGRERERWLYGSHAKVGVS